jgi:hypothetical protein
MTVDTGFPLNDTLHYPTMNERHFTIHALTFFVFVFGLKIVKTKNSNLDLSVSEK